ncbi:hypothetical protein HDU99_004677, partial [Rhizoclosmatium hyalinum]
MTQHIAVLPTLIKWSNPSETEQAITEYIASNKIEAGTIEHAEFLTQLARAQGLQKHFDQANETLSKVKSTFELVESQLEDADSDSDAARSARRVRVRYLLERGRVLNSSGNPEAAIAPFRMAMQVARLSDSLAEYQVDAIHMLAIAVSDQDEKVAWTAKAIALCEKSTDPETK